MPNRRVAVDVSVRGSAFGREMAEMSAQATAAGAAVRSIPNEVTVRARSTGLDKLESDARRAERSTSGVVDAAVALWPALIPVTTLAVPALAGLAAQFTVAAAAGGVMIGAFNGVGDALKALDAAQLDPTAANLEKLDQAMSALGPDGRAFVRELDQLEPKLRSLKVAAEGGVLSGATEGLDELLDRLPQVRRIITEISDASGTLLSDAGRGIASPELDDFFNYLERDGKPILLDTGRALGNFTAGFAHLLVDLAPSERDFVQFLLNSSRSFKDWTAGLDDTSGLQDLFSYIDETGPEVGETVSAIASAFVAVARAGAPLSGPVLDSLQALATIVEKIADSPLGTPLVTLASGLALVNRALAVSALAKDNLVVDLLYGRNLGAGTRGPNAIARVRGQVRGLGADLKTANTFGGFAGIRALGTPAQIEAQAAAAGRLRTRLAGVGRGAAGVAAIAASTGLLGESVNKSNTATLALAGSMAGPYGAAAGAAVGLTLDLVHANDDLESAIRSADRAISDGNLEAKQRERTRSLKAITDSEKARTYNVLDANPLNRIGATVAGVNELFTGSSKKAQIKVDTLDAQIQMGHLRQRAILAGQGLSTTAAGARALTYSSKEMATELAAGQAALGRAGNLSAYRSAILDARDALKQNGKTLDDNTRKGQANNAALRALANNALNVANDLSGASRVRFLDGARKQFIAAAIAAGATKERARELAGQFHLLDLLHPSVKVTVDGVPTAKANVAQLINALTGLHDKTIRINTVTTNSKTPMAQGYATGGLIQGPGGSREDQVPIWASDGEYVMNAAATRQFRNEIEWMNAQGLARGGFASAPPPSVRVAAPSLSGVVLEGTLETPWGPAHVRGIAREAAGEVVRQHAGMTGVAARSGPRR